MTALLEFWWRSLPQLLSGLAVSLEVTGIALAVGIPLGLGLALAVQSRRAAVRYPALAFVEIGRGAPALILLQFAYFGLPSAGISLSSLAAALQAVPRGQVEAATAVGMTQLDSLRFVVVPQAMRIAAPALLGFSILMLQASSLCFAIALPELLSQAYMIGTTTFRYLPILCLAGLLYAAICIPATFAVAALEKRLGRHAA